MFPQPKKRENGCYQYLADNITKEVWRFPEWPQDGHKIIFSLSVDGKWSVWTERKCWIGSTFTSKAQCCSVLCIFVFFWVFIQNRKEMDTRCDMVDISDTIYTICKCYFIMNVRWCVFIIIWSWEWTQFMYKGRAKKLVFKDILYSHFYILHNTHSLHFESLWISRTSSNMFFHFLWFICIISFVRLMDFLQIIVWICSSFC